MIQYIVTSGIDCIKGIMVVHISRKDGKM